jgi:hypothetical protein
MLIRILVLMTLIIQTTYVFGNTEFNIVLVIDESGSMWGSSQHPKANDKYRHRISIVENVIVRLAEQVKGTPLVHRLSVIEFGGDTSVSVAVPISNLELRYDPAKPDELVSKAKMRVASTLYSRKRNMGNTNTSLAMKTALAEFQKLDAARLGTPRERHMLIITDGRPYTYKKTLSDLQRDIKKHAKELDQSKVNLWIVGLNDASNYWNTGDGEFWEELVGIEKARLAQTSFPSIATVVQHIVDQWLKVKSVPLLTEEYHSRPYLKQIVFNVHLSKPGTKLEIIDPNGQPLSQAEGTPQQGTYARYVVNNIIVGTYQINKLSQSGYKIFVEEHAPTLTFIGPHGSINQNVKNRIVFKVMQGEQGLQELPQWPVTAQISVTPPSGNLQLLPATFEGDGKYSAHWTPIEIGHHKFYFQAKVNVQTNKGPRQYDLVDTSVTGSVEVQAYMPSQKQSFQPPVPKNAIWLHLETPDPEDGLNLSPWADTATIKLSLYEGQDQVTTIENLVDKPDTWLTLEVMDKSGIALSEQPIPLKVEGEYFVAQISDSWWTADQLHLRVVAEHNRLPEDRKLHGIWLPESVEDKRLYGDPMTVAEIDINLSFWVLLLVFFFIILLLLGLIWLSIQYLLPWLTIRGEDRGRIVNLLIYDGLDDPSAVTAKKVAITGQSRSKLDGQIRVMIEGKALVAEFFRVKRSPNPSSPTATVQYRWQGEGKDKRHSLMLSGKTPKPFEGINYGNYMIALGY